MKSFEELDVWKKAHLLVLDIYKITVRFPKEERFGIVSQLRRAATSIPANIAEGFGRRTTKDYVRFLDMSAGSLNEARYFLILSRDLDHISPTEYSSLRSQCDEVGRLLGGLIQSLLRRLR